MGPDEKRIQRERYEKIASEYDQVHCDPEHVVAFAFMRGMLEYVDAKSVLDVGAGTGRVLLALRESRPDLRLRGIEPVEALRKVGHVHGIPPADLTDGDGYRLQFADGEFDVVCEFGVLHHVREPDRVVSEMLRVARTGIFISDSNNFGGGSPAVRLVKQCLHDLKLWGIVNYIKTGGRGYSITEGDGLFYSYSVFDTMPLLRQRCRITYMMNTTPAGANLYRSANHLAVFAMK